MKKVEHSEDLIRSIQVFMRLWNYLLRPQSIAANAIKAEILYAKESGMEIGNAVTNLKKELKKHADSIHDS